jgi:hypothetical protein
MRSLVARQLFEFKFRVQMPHDNVPSNLDDSPEHLDFVLKAGGLGVWRIDLAGEMTCSALCKANFGVEPNSPFSYEDVQAMIWPNDLETWKSEIDRALRDGEIFEVEYRIMTKAGENRCMPFSAGSKSCVQIPGCRRTLERGLLS